MPSGVEDYAELEALQQQLMEEVESMRRSGLQLARNERAYRKALATRMW